VTGNVVKLLTALRDLDEAADYIRRQSGPERAIRFLREADATFQRLASMPGIGTRYAPDEPVFADLRVFPVSRFKKYLTFYRPIADGVEVLRVLHGARDIEGTLAEDFRLGEGGEDDRPPEEPDTP
jgi:toxin ParE1/3/4